MWQAVMDEIRLDAKVTVQVRTIWLTVSKIPKAWCILCKLSYRSCTVFSCYRECRDAEHSVRAGGLQKAALNTKMLV